MKEHEKVISEKYLSIIKSKKESRALKLNDIVALKSHPYQALYTSPKIGAYAKFTPPLMIVIEILTKSTHDVSTGQKDSNHYKCLFYSTVEGKYEKLWFKSNELKFISEYSKEDFGVSSPSIFEWKKELMGKEVILQTVDLELGKKKTFQDIVDGRSKMKDSTLLDYLPPIGSVIDVKYEEDHTKHSEKTGKVTAQKQALHAKIKWLNNESGRMSEDTIPLECLKFVNFNNNEFLYETKKTYLLPLKERKELESNANLYYKTYPVYLKSITFKHYYYVYSVSNVFSKKSSTHSVSFPVEAVLNFDQLLRDGDDLGNSTEIQSFFKPENVEMFRGKWYYISYIDKQKKYTERIVYVLDFPASDDVNVAGEELNKTLRCNCLLREGSIRNFRVEGIQKCIELPSEFEKIFFERV